MCEALYADDAAFCSHFEEQQQSIIESFSNTCSAFGLKISVKKTQVAKITLNDEALETHFSYLGSIMSNNFTLDKELNTRLGKAATSFGRLSKRVWSNKSLTLHTKLKVYQARATCTSSCYLYKLVLPVQARATCTSSCYLYKLVLPVQARATCTTYHRQEMKLNSFHVRCLRTILGVKRQDKITNLEILQLNSTKQHSKTATADLDLVTYTVCPLTAFLGHVHRMPIDRLPKQIMYGELTGGKRPVGQPKLRYKDVIKRDLKDYGIDPMHWQTVAEERPTWRTSLTGGSAIDIKAYQIQDQACEAPCSQSTDMTQQTQASSHKTEAGHYYYYNVYV